MNIASRRALPAFAFLTLALSACGKSNTPAATAGDAPTLESHELRSLLQIADMQALPATPQVDAELYDLGHALFFDKVLSGNRDVSCATCHWPDLGSADDRTLPLGVGGVGLGKARTGGAIVPRNSPAILNTHLLDQMFWDGRVEHSPDGVSTPAGEALTPEMRAILDPRWELLAAQAMFPPTSRHEMRGEIGESELGNIENKNTAEIWDKLTQRLMDIPEYQRMFLAAYPDLTSISEVQFAHAANAIAAFEVKAFAHTDSPFERFVKGDDEALTDHQIEGAREFFGDAGCAQCHSGNTFTDSDFHNIGLPQFGPGKGDGASKLEDFGRERVTGSTADRYQIRTASLLNIALTAPYGHMGQYATLKDFVHHYTNPEQSLLEYDIFAHVTDPALSGTLADNRSEILDHLDPHLRRDKELNEEALVAFLQSLTAESAVDMSSLIPAGVPSGLSIR